MYIKFKKIKDDFNQFFLQLYKIQTNFLGNYKLFKRDLCHDIIFILDVYYTINLIKSIKVKFYEMN